MSAFEEMVARHGFTPERPVEATQVLPIVRPSTPRPPVAYPDPGPDLAALRHTRWQPEDPVPAAIDAAAVWEQGGAILRRLHVIEALLAQVLAERKAGP